MSRAAFEHACLTGPLFPADAIVALTGDGHNRLATVIELFRNRAAPIILVSGGVDNPPFSQTAAHQIGLLLEKGVSPDRLLCENDSQHTSESAEKIIDMAQERDWHRLLLVTSSYHIPRAMLSIIAVLNERGIADEVDVIPVPAPMPMFEVPEGYVDKTRLELVDLEAEKVAEYADDVASYDEGLAYLAHWEANR